MRNNAKLKKLLKCADVTMASDGEDMSWMIFEKDTQTSFIVKGSNITSILDESLKTIHKIHKNGTASNE